MDIDLSFLPQNAQTIVIIAMYIGVFYLFYWLIEKNKMTVD